MKLFCRHKDSKEITRFYNAHYSGLKFTRRWDAYRIYFLDVYKCFLCNKCGKRYKKKVLSKKYSTRSKWLYDMNELGGMGYIPYERYVTE